MPNQVAFVYLTDGEENSIAWTYRQLDQRARAIAHDLIAKGMSGEKALLLYPPGLDFVAGLFGCFYAGVVAVPVYPPRRNRNMGRIQAIANDANAKLAMTVGEHVDRVQRFLDDAPQLRDLMWFATDEADPEYADQWRRPTIHADSLALLQYTSGSTGVPKGVMLTHQNILHNCHFITQSFGASPDDVGMSWLPTYHDMGLIGGVLNPMFIGCSSILMSPTTFLQKPVRWLKTITRHRVTVSGGPNFAFDVCTKKVTSDEMEGLDLSSWKLAFNGAEPVRTSTIQNFARKFASVGFQIDSFYPCYGMAESTLMITGGKRHERPVIRSFGGPELELGSVAAVETVNPNARQLVGCGQPPKDGDVVIVDPAEQVPCAADRIGEIWVASGSIGQGYLNKPNETADCFQARLPGDDKHYLRTGDLGFLYDDQLFVTGRIKDLIIVRGINRYPQDIELTVEQSDTRLRAGTAAAFAVDMDNRDQLIVVCEVERIAENNWDEVIGAIRRNVTATHDLPPDGIILIRAGSIPKTSSGKIQRHACRDGFLDDSLMVIADWFVWNDKQSPEDTDGEATSDAALSDHHSGNHASTATAANKGTGNGKPSEDDSLHRVFEVVRDVAGDRAGQLTAETNIVELGLDSLERIEVANRLERIFGGMFPEEVLVEIETCGQVADAIRTHLGASTKNGRHASPPIQSKVTDFPEYQSLRNSLESVEASGLSNPYFNVHEGTAADTTQINGRVYINFSSYNYLGLSGHPTVNEAAAAAARRFGTSCSASRVVSGERPIHRDLEREIADLIGVPAALTFVGGHSTNETTIGHLCGSGDLVLHDALSHNSIIQGAVLSGARRRQFPHNDWSELEKILAAVRRDFRRVLVVIEGAYSMDGDYPDLPRFVSVVQKHASMLMVDEAHSIGTMGATGRGISEHYSIDPNDVHIWMGTLSKAFGSCGGYIAGSAELIEYLKYTAPGFVYSVGLSPPNTAAALAAIRLLRTSPERAQRCQQNSRRFLRLLKAAGLNTGRSADTPVVPVITGNSEHALQLSQQLYGRGINVQPILYPAVEEKAARLRFFISSEHSDQQLEQTADAVREEYERILAKQEVAVPATMKFRMDAGNLTPPNGALSTGNPSEAARFSDDLT